VPDGGTYRISVKQEPHGVASSYLNSSVLKPGESLDVAAPRGDFVLDEGAGPVLLISAGIGATPVLAMLHQLAAGSSQREIWCCTGPAGRASTPLRPRRTICWPRCPAPRSTCSTVRPLPPSAKPPALPPGSGPLVTFTRSGITAPVGDDRRSVLDLADACDVPARWSCRTGVCHTCVTPLLSGDITYAPDPLELPADGQVLICCARPATDIVLDM
jgi:ferredoxin